MMTISEFLVELSHLFSLVTTAKLQLAAAQLLHQQDSDNTAFPQPELDSIQLLLLAEAVAITAFIASEDYQQPNPIAFSAILATKS